MNFRWLTVEFSAPQQKLAQNNPKLGRFTQYLIQLLAEWVDTFPYDFRDERLMTQLRDITQISIQINPSLRADVSQLLQNLLSKLQSLEKYEEHMEKLNQQTGDECDSTDKSNGLQQQISVHSNHSHKSSSSNSSSIVSTLTHQTDISEMCSSPLLLAHQLTHIELQRLSHIGPEEFVQAFTKEHPSIETSFKDLKKTRNLESYVTWFNRLSYLVATDVIKVCWVERHRPTAGFSNWKITFFSSSQHPKKKQRVRIIEFWIETGRESFNIGNFNSLMAIIAGLNMSPISRLKKTVSSDHFGFADREPHLCCFCSGRKSNRPNSPSSSTRWTRRATSAATDRHWRRRCGDQLEPPMSANASSFHSSRFSSRIFTSWTKAAQISKFTDTPTHDTDD